MAYILIEFAGQKTFGGYLKIDGGRQIPLYDGQMIRIEPGTHYLSYSTQSASQRGIAKLNAWAGNNRIAAAYERNAVDGDITESFGSNEAMLFTVVSDGAGHVLDQPQYRMKEFDDEEIKEFDKLYAEQLADIQQEIADDKNGAGIELILCIFLGWLGAHKFYKKRFGMGLIYLFTMGVFGLGVLVDFFAILGRLLRK